MHTTRITAALLVFMVLIFPLPSSAQDGTLDPTWFGGGRRTIDAGDGSSGSGLAFQSDGKIILWGNCDSPPGSGVNDPCLARLFPSGDLDVSFGPSGTGLVRLSQLANFLESYAVGVVVRSDDMIAIVANRTDPLQGFIVARLGWNGDTLLGSTSFQFDGLAAQPRSAVGAVIPGPDDTIIVAGSTHSAQQLALARIAVGGDGLPTLDSSFSASGVRLIPFASITGAKIGDVHLTHDGGLLVLVKHNFWYANPDFGTLSILRYTANGERDLAFGEVVVPKCAGTDGVFDERTAIDTVGRIVIAWGAWYPADVNPPTDLCVNRLLPNGVQDPSFGGYPLQGIPPGPLAINIGREDAPNFSYEFFGGIAVGADNKILLGGNYFGTLPSCNGCAMTVRLREFPFVNHALDTSYGNNGVALWQYTATSTFDWVYSIEIAQGELLITGSASIFATGAVPTFSAAKLRLGPHAFDPIFANGFEQPLEP